MPIDDDFDALVSRLSAPLAPDDQLAFRAAVESALIPGVVWGSGNSYRVAAQLWRGYFHPPPDNHVAGPARKRWSSKAINAPAIGNAQ